jgi:hypothetical protein
MLGENTSESLSYLKDSDIKFLEIKVHLEKFNLDAFGILLIQQLITILEKYENVLINFYSASYDNLILIEAVGRLIILLNENDLPIERIFIKFAPSSYEIENFLKILKNIIVPAIPGIFVFEKKKKLYAIY